MNQVSRGLRAAGSFFKKKKKSKIGIGLALISALLFFGSYFGSQYKASSMHNLFYNNPRSLTTLSFQRKISQRALRSASENANFIGRFHLEQALGKEGGGIVISKSSKGLEIAKNGRKAISLADSKGVDLFHEAYPTSRSLYTTQSSVRKRYGVVGKFFEKLTSGKDEDVETKKKLSVFDEPEIDGKVGADTASAETGGDELAKIVDDIDSAGVSEVAEKETVIASKVSSLKSINNVTGILAVYCGAQGFAKNIDRMKMFISNKAFVRVAGILGVVANSVSVGRANPKSLESFMTNQLGTGFESSKGYTQALRDSSYFKSKKPDILPSKSLPNIKAPRYSDSSVFSTGVGSLCQINKSPVVQGGLVAVNTGAAVATGGASALVPIIGGIVGIAVLADKLEPILTDMLTDVIINHSGILQAETITKKNPQAFADAAKIGDEIMISEEKRSLGGQKLSPEQTAKIKSFYLAEAKQLNNSLDLKTKLFANQNPYSLLAITSKRLNTFFSDNLLRDFLGFTVNLLSGVNNTTRTMALIGIVDYSQDYQSALAAEDVEKGISEYEFEPELLDIDPLQAQKELFGSLSPAEILSSNRLSTLAKKYQKCFTGDDSEDFESSSCNDNLLERRNFTVWHLSCLATSGIGDFYNDSSAIDYQPCGVYYGPGSGDSATKTSINQNSTGVVGSDENASGKNTESSLGISNKDVATLASQGAQALAGQILSNSNISFNSNPRCSIEQASKYGQYRGTSFINDKGYNDRTCDDGGTTSVPASPGALAVLLILSEKYSFTVTSIATGGHARDSQHFSGRAIDIGTVNGTRITGGTINTGAIKQFYVDLINLLPSGARIGQNDCDIVNSSLYRSKGLVAFGSDGCDHIHFGN